MHPSPLSTWTQGKVWRLDDTGMHAEVILDGLESAADFYLDEPNEMLLVPDMKAGKLFSLPLNRTP